MARRPALNRPDREVHDVLCASDVLCVLLLPRFPAGVVEAAIHAFGRVYVGCAYDLEEALRQEGAETRSAAGVGEMPTGSGGLLINACRHVCRD